MGECVDYGNKFASIYLISILTAGMVILISLLSRIEPRAANIAQPRKAYTEVGAVMLLFFLVLRIILMLNILGSVINIGSYWPLLVGLVLIVIGDYLSKLRSKFFFVIRTPWLQALWHGLLLACSR